MHAIDSGLVKTADYDAETDLKLLSIGFTLKASATQRRGRVGRNSRGKCYRMYTVHQ